MKTERARDEMIENVQNGGRKSECISPQTPPTPPTPASISHPLQKVWTEDGFYLSDLTSGKPKKGSLSDPLPDNSCMVDFEVPISLTTARLPRAQTTQTPLRAGLPPLLGSADDKRGKLF